MKWSVPPATLCLCVVLLTNLPQARAASTPALAASSAVKVAPLAAAGCPPKCAVPTPDARGNDPGIGPDKKANVRRKSLAHRKTAVNPTAAPVVRVAPVTPATPAAPAAPVQQPGQ